MAGAPFVYEGACHCGAVRVRYEARTEPALRACQCSFCRRHGAKTTSDPEGLLAIKGAPSIYRFASRSADVLICAVCGCYIASRIDGPQGQVATLNVVGVGIAALAQAPAAPVVYDVESADQKRARRLARWTPIAPHEGDWR